MPYWQVIVPAGGFLFFWGWESFRPFFEQRGRIRHAARNLAVAALNAVVLTLVFAGLNISLAAATEVRGWGLLNAVNLPAPARAVAAFVLLDCWTYWWHRLNHRLPLLWRFHRMHHSDDNMDVSTATRFHLGEIVISAAIRLALIPVIGIPLGAILAYDLILLVATQFHHSNIGLRGVIDRWLRYLIVSPNMHKVHHSQEQVETDSNYASIFSVWDRLFGTYRGKADYHEIRFGLPAWTGSRFQSLLGMLATPFEVPRRQMSKYTGLRDETRRCVSDSDSRGSRPGCSHCSGSSLRHGSSQD